MASDLGMVCKQLGHSMKSSVDIGFLRTDPLVSSAKNGVSTVGSSGSNPDHFDRLAILVHGASH